MRDEDNPFARPLEVRGGVLVADGYGVRVRVERGRLVVSDGVGEHGRRVELARATAGLRRLVLLGEAGYVTLEALRWIAGVGAALVHLDRDGTLLAHSASLGLDHPALRRAQARAWGTRAGEAVARHLVATKLRGQLALLDRPPGGPASRPALEAALAEVGRAEGLPRIRLAEAGGAKAYWAAWEGVPVRFARRDEGRVPDHWKRFGGRASPLTGGPRLAADPANAILNYLYALAEAEARLACLAVGLDPGVGVLHADQRARDSMALDLLEAVRPAVDGYLLDLLGSRTFRARDFHEDRRGSCRLLRPLAHALAATSPAWARAVAPVAEEVARMLAGGDLPTPLTQDRRSAGRDGVRRRPRRVREARPPMLPACRSCGGAVPRGRLFCDRCLPEVDRERFERFQRSGPAALARMRAEGRDPMTDPEVRRRLSSSQARRLAADAAWDRGHPEAPDPEVFRREILPRLRGVPLRRMVEATGLSLRHCPRIRRGEAVPHPRHWEALQALTAREGGP
jgi:CRISPR-associated endonuclease Cas1